ncbi:MAG: NADH-quinone oxidoreductase subunit D, partial [Clostridiales bacterium]
MTSQIYTINLGPQHPSTHGVLHIIVDMDGEYCVGCEARVGYLHRGIEKLAEYRTYPQIIPYKERLDYMAGLYKKISYVLAVENRI